jgi:hypothetical protein
VKVIHTTLVGSEFRGEKLEAGWWDSVDVQPSDGVMDRVRGSRVRCHISRRSSRGRVGNDGRGGVECSITIHDGAGRRGV